MTPAASHKLKLEGIQSVQTTVCVSMGVRDEEVIDHLRLRCESPFSMNCGKRRWSERPLLVIAIDWRPYLRNSLKLAAVQ